MCVCMSVCEFLPNSLSAAAVMGSIVGSALVPLLTANDHLAGHRLHKFGNKGKQFCGQRLGKYVCGDGTCRL